MRHAPMTLSKQLSEEPLRDKRFDLLWCSDMLNLPEFLGFARRRFSDIPCVVYFHENQLTYPVQEFDKRDLHFAYTNFLTCCAADGVWFNSEFHKDEYGQALESYLRRMPTYRHLQEIDAIRSKSMVLYPGIDTSSVRIENPKTQSGPIRICWNARWEHDKNPNDFFSAMRLLNENGVRFELIVLGESFRQSPAIFGTAKKEFNNQIIHWGYAEDRSEYRRWLTLADLVVSTANHEFFGLAIVEGMAAGAHPCLPNRLAYPEVISALTSSENPFEISPIYDGTVSGLASRLGEAVTCLPEIRKRKAEVSSLTKTLSWEKRTNQFDDEIERIVSEF